MPPIISQKLLKDRSDVLEFAIFFDRLPSPGMPVTCASLFHSFSMMRFTLELSDRGLRFFSGRDPKVPRSPPPQR